MNITKLNHILFKVNKYKIDNESFNTNLIRDYDIFYFICYKKKIKIKKHIELFEKDDFLRFLIYGYFKFAWIFFKNLFKKKEYKTVKQRLRECNNIEEFVQKNEKKFFKNISKKNSNEIEIIVYLIPKNKFTKEAFKVLFTTVNKWEKSNLEGFNFKQILFSVPIFSVLISLIFIYELRGLGLPIDVFYENVSIVSIFLFLNLLILSFILVGILILIILQIILEFVTRLFYIITIGFFYKTHYYYIYTSFIIKFFINLKDNFKSFSNSLIFISLFIISSIMISCFIYDFIRDNLQLKLKKSFLSTRIYSIYQEYTGYPKFAHDSTLDKKLIIVGQKDESNIVYNLKETVEYITMKDLYITLNQTNINKTNFNKIISLKKQYQTFCFDIDYKKIDETLEKVIIFEIIKNSKNNQTNDYSTIHSLLPLNTLPFKLKSINQSKMSIDKFSIKYNCNYIFSMELKDRLNTLKDKILEK